MHKSHASNKMIQDNCQCSTTISFKNVTKKSNWLMKFPRMIKSLIKPNESVQSRNDSRLQSTHYSISSTMLDPESLMNYQELLDSDNWVYNYLHGASMEIYSAEFSIAFDGLQFTEAAVVCRKYLGLLLIAIVAKVSDNKNSLLVNRITKNLIYFNSSNNINDNLDENNSHDDNDDDYNNESINNTKYYLAVSPTLDSNAIINYGTIGFFICDSQENANKVSFYCLTCHANNNNNNNNNNNSSLQCNSFNIQPCTCQLKLQKSTLKFITSEFFKSKSDSCCITKNSKLNKQIIRENSKVCSIIPELNESEKVSILPLLLNDKEEINKESEELNSKIINESNSKRRTLSRRDSLISAYDTEEQYSDVHKNQPRRSSDTDVHSKTSTVHPTYEFDITGMYYYCERQSFEDNLITPNSPIKQSQDLYNHILVCILAEPDAPLLGLHSFVMPLRASNFHTNQLRTILFLGDIKFLQREWSSIANFPKVYTLAGSPLSRADLRAARIQYSSVCVILGSRGTVKVDDPYMLDKEVILCTLNIRAMEFSPYRRHKTFGQTILKRRKGSEIPLITELMTDNNIHYLDPDHSGGVQIAASLTAPFAKGIAFTSSVLDVLASTAYFDRNSMTLIRHLVTGGVTPALEQWLAEGGGLIGYRDWYFKEKALLTTNNQSTRKDLHPFSDFLETRQRPRIEQISLTNPRLTRTSNNDQITLFDNYGDLFCHAIQEHGILCLGIYRLSFNTSNGLSRLVTVPYQTTKSKIDSIDEPMHDIENIHEINDTQLTAKLHRRLSTCGLPIDRVLRKHSLQLNRKSISIEDNSQHLPYQQEQNQHDNQTMHQNAFVQLIDQHFNKFGLNRYVISNPPNHFELYPTDVVFCLCPFENEIIQ
ncbi:Calcium-activated potassium channel slowpoke [Schistosoma japonicum]|nr:Calcium-activated potassium channel slowpoke [Schistosoma japonicum]